MDLGPEHCESTVPGAECLEALVALLSVVQAGTQPRDRNFRSSNERWGAPLAGACAKSALDVAIRGEELLSREIGPVYTQSDTSGPTE